MGPSPRSGLTFSFAVILMPIPSCTVNGDTKDQDRQSVCVSSCTSVRVCVPTL